MRKTPESAPTRLDELAILVEVSAAGSMAAAAKRLGVPKSTVGRAVARLEQEMSVELVRRVSRGPALTESGRLMAQLASPHVAALRDLSRAIERDASEAYGTLRVTAPSDIGTIVLAPLLPQFAARYPRIHVEVELTRRVVDIAREGFDFAVRVAPRQKLPASTLVAKKLARLDLGLYAGSNYVARHELPKQPAELAQHEVVLFDGRNGKSVLHLEGTKADVRVAVTGHVSANDFFFMREAIVSSAGIGTLPWFVAQPELAAGRMVRVLPDYRLAGMTAYLVQAPHASLTNLPPKLRAFRTFFLEHAPQRLVHP